MKLLKAKAEAAPAAPVTREEFDAFKRVVALGFMSGEEAAKYPGVTGGVSSTHRRLEKIAASAADLFDLDTAEVRELRGFLALLKQARDGERRREFNENQERSRPRCADDYMAGGRFAPRV